MKTTKSIVRNETIVSCDICQKCTTRSSAGCAGCGRDLCEACENVKFTDIWNSDDLDFDDYPEHVCDYCLEEEANFADELAKVKKDINDLENTLAELKKKWIDNCKNKRKETERADFDKNQSDR